MDDFEKSLNTVTQENGLTNVRGNSELVQMYKESAKVGSKNIGTGIPQLKVHSVGRSDGNVLANGEKPKDGHFYYKPTKQAFETIDCHILSISKGFYADGYKEKKHVFNQILSGLIQTDGEMLPFIMYFTGTRLDKMWKFGKEASQYTKNKELPIPMFALTVKLSTETLKTKYGSNWIINFDIKRYEDGSPIVILDPILFKGIRDKVEMVEASIEELVELKKTDEEEYSPSQAIV